MATRDQLRDFKTRRPFQPFTIALGSGRTLTVRQPELASCSTNGREMIVYDDEGMHFLEMLTVKFIEDAAEAARTEPPRPDGNG